MELSKCLGCMDDFQGYPCPHCGYDPAQEPRPEYALPKETILAGKYLVGRVLGQGGFGITYIGWDIALERKVAIKEYYPSGQVSRSPGNKSLTWYTNEPAVQAREDGMKMFLKEARKMVKADSIPGVVRVLDLFQENDTAYIVMDFVSGETLKAWLQKNGPMTWAQAAPIFLPAIRAMEQVHQAGLIHRDLSPDNLMLTPEGGVKILDLGAAKDLSLNSGASSIQVAKSGFSPLEQYTQRGGSGSWTDVYSMAATIYYTLTGKLPPNAVDRMEEDAIDWNLPNLDTMPLKALDALKNAMAVSSKQRTRTMAELLRNLGGGIPPYPGPQPKPPKPAPRPNPEKPRPNWLVPVISGVSCIIALVIILVSFNSRKAEEDSSTPILASTTSSLLESETAVPETTEEWTDSATDTSEIPIETFGPENSSGNEGPGTTPGSTSSIDENWHGEDSSSSSSNMPKTILPNMPENTPQLELRVGQTYTMGSYEQDGTSSNGPEPIDWLVLDVENDRALLISKYCLDAAQFHSTQTAVTWETCDLRKWLNSSFLDTAFTKEEKSMILSTSLSTPKSAYGEKTGGNDTVDKLFCLSSDEASSYFSSDNDRKATLTPYAARRTSYSWWWLRSPGGATDAAKAIVNADGLVTTGGNWVDNNDSVRPAMWISTQ